MDPTPTDISDKSGNGHHPVWVGSNRPALYTDDTTPTVATPVMSPTGGNFTGSVTVSLTVATSGADIYYTTDGSTPDTTSTLYSSPLTLIVSTTVKAKAFKSGMNPSGVASEAYTITADNTPPTLHSCTAFGDPNRVQVVFSEAVDPTTATNAANYAISNGVSVLDATLGGDIKTVTLETSNLSRDIIYTLTVNDVQDSSGNTVATDSQITFTFTPIDVSQGLVAYWPFEEGSGSTTDDVSGNGHTGSLKGPTWYTSGKVGSALAFDGNNDVVNTGSWDVSGNELTLALWLNADSFGVHDARLISKSISTAEQDHYWMLSTISDGGNKLRFRLKTNGTTTTLVANSGILSTGQWVHVAAVYDGSTMKLFKDGEEVGSTGKNGSLSTNGSAEVTIGLNPDGYGPWDGLLDEVRVYNRALTEAEIATLAGVGGQPPAAPKNLRIIPN